MRDGLRSWSSLRTQGPITTGAVAGPRKATHTAFSHSRRGVWVPAFAGTTGELSASILKASTHLRDLATLIVRGLPATSRPRKSEGAGKTGCTLHPRSRVQLRTGKAHTSIQVQAEHPGLPCAVALRLTSCSPRRTALLPPSPPRSLLLENLTPAPRRQDHTTSPYACATHVDCGLRVHRIPPHVRDDREPPLSSGETRKAKSLICPTRRAEFCPSG